MCAKRKDLMMFQLNEKVFYPGYGVAMIENIIERVVLKNKTKFFKLKFIYKDITILVPFNGGAENVGIRHLSAKKVVMVAIDELQKIPSKKNNATDLSPNSWNRRNKDYQLKIQKGKLIDMMHVYRDLMYASKEKELSFGEKKLLQTTKELILQEISTVQNEDREVVMQLLQNPFQQLNFPQKLDSEASVLQAI